MSRQMGRVIATACVFALFLSLNATAQDIDNIRGLVTPRNQAIISSEISARIIELPFRAGDAFAKDDVLVKFDCAMYQAQRDAAAANRDARQTEFKNGEELLSYNATSPIQVEILKNEMKKAQAQFEMEQLRVEWCTIRAPYDGRVINLQANEHESVNSGAKLLSVLSNEQLEIELIVPSSWLSWLQKNARFSIRLDETGADYAATVARIGATVDPVSQTVQVIGLFDLNDKNGSSVRAGMSGTATFRRQ